MRHETPYALSIVRTLAAPLVTAVFASACLTTPPATSVTKVRAEAVQAADGMKTALAIVREAGHLLDASTVPQATKDDINCAVIRATGTTAPPSATLTKVCGPLPNGPGPLVQVEKLLGQVTTDASLKSTLAAALPYVTALVDKLGKSGDANLAAFAVVLKTAIAFSQALIGGAA